MLTKKSISFPFPIDRPISQFYGLQYCLPGDVSELPNSANWMKLWKYITLELKQSSIWFLPYTNGNIVARLMQKRWSKSDIERIKEGEYIFYTFDDGDMKSIVATIYLDLDKHKKDWLIIKNSPGFVEKNREQIERIAKNLNIRVIIMCK